jgi:predicted transcriptional regulator
MDWKANLPDKVKPVVRLLAHGYTPEQIADELCLATCTIRNYIQEARDIVGAQNATQLGAWYFYRYGNINRDFAPITKRISKFFLIAVLMYSTTQIDVERAFRTARRGRRRDDTEQLTTGDSPQYTA